MVATPPTRRATCSGVTSSRTAPSARNSVEHPPARRLQHLALAADRGGVVAHGARDLGRAALVHADQPDVLLEPVEEPLAGSSLVGESLLGRLLDVVDPRLHDRVDEVVARGEVPVERARSDARLLGDEVEGRVVALLPEDLSSHLDDAVTVALGIGTHGTFTFGLAKRRQSPYCRGGSGVILRIYCTSAPQGQNRTAPHVIHHLPAPAGIPARAPDRAAAAGRPRRRRHRDRPGRPADDRARRHGRERRAPAHRRRPRLRPRVPLVGPQRLHARLRRAAAPRGAPRRRPRPPPHLRGRARRLHRRLRARRARPDARASSSRPARSRASARPSPHRASSPC